MRFPLDPLLPHVARRFQAHPNDSFVGELGQIVRVLGISRGWAMSWQRDGLTVDHADNAAVALGCHPADIWPEWFDDANANPCDTPGHGGIKRHRNAGEPLCLDCAAFDADYQRDWRRRNPESERARVTLANARRPDKHRNAVRNAKEAA